MKVKLSVLMMTEAFQIIQIHITYLTHLVLIYQYNEFHLV